jgi:general stress protein YciG
MAKQLNEAARALGRKGGRRRAKNLTAEQRREIARKGAETRWAKKGGKKNER